MNLLKTATDFIGGSLFGEIKDTVMAYLPPDVTPLQKAEMELKVTEMLNKKQNEANETLNEASNSLNKRIAEQEGTAAELKSIPFVGAVLITLRGVQRPVWGFATLYFDYKWLFDSDGVVYTVNQEYAIMGISLLVLGFLFGERAVQNLIPLITNFIGARK